MANSKKNRENFDTFLAHRLDETTRRYWRHTAPLRERLEDIPELLAFYAERHAPEGRPPIGFDEELMQALVAYRWPGNVRELSNLVDRFTTLFPGQQVQLRALRSFVLLSQLPQLGLQAFGC